jgi:hypothetical protein
VSGGICKGLAVGRIPTYWYCNGERSLVPLQLQPEHANMHASPGPIIPDRPRHHAFPVHASLFCFSISRRGMGPAGTHGSARRGTHDGCMLGPWLWLPPCTSTRVHHARGASLGRNRKRSRVRRGVLARASSRVVPGAFGLVSLLPRDVCGHNTKHG